MRIIFAGTPPNAARTLQFLIENSHQVVGVLTKEDAPAGRNRQLLQTPVAEVAKANDIALYKANRVDDDTRAWIKGLNPDLGLIVAFGCILKHDDLVIPNLGWMNLHFSILPEFPGPAPVQHALISGASETGVSLFMLNEGIDSGPIVASRKIGIKPNINSSQLLAELTDVGNELLQEVLEDLPHAISNAKPQPTGASFSVAIKPKRQLARIDFDKSARDVHNLIRAMNPEPTAWFDYENTSVRVLESELIENVELDSGIAKLVDGKLVVGCSEGSVALVIVQPAGKKLMNAPDWFRGLRVENLKL